jgi:ketosteroid isomerase-like protein
LFTFQRKAQEHAVETKECGTSVARLDDEAEIRGILDAVAEAVRSKNVEGILAHCAADLVTFDLVPPIQHKGADAVRRVWADALAAFWPPLEYDVQHLAIEIGDGVAFSRSLNKFGGTRLNGERAHQWLRSTFAYRKISGRWKIVHQHVSVPFDMTTGKALLGLEP